MVLVSFAEGAKITANRMVDIYAGRSSFTAKQIEFLMEQKEDVYITSSEAVESGFMDEIYDGNRERLLCGGPHVC